MITYRSLGSTPISTATTIQPGNGISDSPFVDTRQRARLMGKAGWLAACGLIAIIIGCGASPIETSKSSTDNPPTVPLAADRADVKETESAPVPPTPNRETQLEQADQWAENGRYDQSGAILRNLLIADPTDVEVIFRLAAVLADSGDLPAAIELLDSIPSDHPDAGLPALGQSADWSFAAKQYQAAEKKYQLILQQVPDAARAHRQLAYLFNRQGRRHEAALHVQELCRLGDFRQDELHSLIVLSDAMVSDAPIHDGADNNGVASPPGETDNDSIDYEPIGTWGAARVLFTQRRFAEAARLISDEVHAQSVPPSVVAFYGRSIAEAQDDEQFERWLQRVDDPVREHAEYWAAMSAFLASRQQHTAAVRAALEALQRDPTDFLTINRLLYMLKILDRPVEYARWEQRWKDLHQILESNNSVSNAATPDVDAISDLASQLFAIDRKLEAVAWKSLETFYRRLPSTAMQTWNAQRQSLVAAQDGFPKLDSKLCGMDLNEYPMPNIKIAIDSQPTSKPFGSSQRPASPATWRNISASIGLTHSFEVSPQRRESGFSMYQQAGGGIAAIDYDRDGWTDLYFAQGAADPPDFTGDRSNILYRTVDTSVIDVTAPSLVTERRYTIGCTAGDWNQDGFPDLVATNLGANVLYLNRGDGTFSDHPLDGSDDLTRMPSSIAIADLSGDHIPDMFELNYIQDAQIARLPNRSADGSVIDAVGPGDFASALDRIAINDGAGHAAFRNLGDPAIDAHKGLGVVIADLDGIPGNEVFVGNDKSPNQMWVRDLKTGEWSDRAVVSGNAYSSSGAATASMGIAVADFDFSGSLDLHIANFQNESVCLYLNQDGFFRDRAMQYDLGVPSRSVLGFGCQSIDYDNNGLPDLAVTNGHIDRYQSMSGPFEQEPQLFGNLGDRFQLVKVTDPTGYWNAGHLGRAMVRLDFDRDGRNDLAVSHLGETSALLRNETSTGHHWLQLQLVGVQSERDAIGAKVTIQVGDRTQVGWMVGGDGYLARNEPVLAFGLANAQQIDQIIIDWPSGQRQIIDSVVVDQRILVVEGQSDPEIAGKVVH